MGALVSFLGGSAFRALWSSVSGYFEKRQDHKYEIERMQLQMTLDDAAATRAQAAIKQQAELGIKTIGVQADADISRTEADAFRAAMERAAQPTGIKWVDAWNSSVRPAFATSALCLWLFWEFRHMAVSGWVLSAWSLDLIGVVVGFYFADRSLSKRGK
jgi:hypothetical protein